MVLHPKKLDEVRKLVKESEKLIVFDFFATWCGPCVRIAPKFEEFSKTYSDVEFVKIDVDDAEFNPLCKEYKIRAMPTFKFVKKGSLVGEVVGGDPQSVENKIKELK